MFPREDRARRWSGAALAFVTLVTLTSCNEGDTRALEVAAPVPTTSPGSIEELRLREVGNSFLQMVLYIADCAASCSPLAPNAGHGGFREKLAGTSLEGLVGDSPVWYASAGETEAGQLRALVADHLAARILECFVQLPNHESTDYLAGGLVALSREDPPAPYDRLHVYTGCHLHPALALHVAEATALVSEQAHRISATHPCAIALRDLTIQFCRKAGELPRRTSQPWTRGEWQVGLMDLCHWTESRIYEIFP